MTRLRRKLADAVAFLALTVSAAAAWIAFIDAIQLR